MNCVGKPMPHESAAGHVSGTALFTDDLLGRFPGILHAWPVMAPHAHAEVIAIDVSAAAREAGVAAVLTAADVPGEANIGVSRRDEPLFPSEISYYHQPVAWVLGETTEIAREAAGKVPVEYRELPAILTIPDAIAAQSFFIRTRAMQAR